MEIKKYDSTTVKTQSRVHESYKQRERKVTKQTEKVE